MFQTGDQIGSYILKEQIGRGAFGVVWLAEETTFLTSHKVALKLPSESAVNIEAIRQEAALWEQVKGHPNILPIIKADVVNNQIFIASEYAPDGSLSDWIRDHHGTAPSVSAAIEMTKGILAGLAHLHSRGVIHRDLKPENILLQGEIPRIADFGIARLLKESQHSAQIAGTPVYMAPEGFNGIRSEQTDIWAVGVIFYQMLTGLWPYPQADFLSMVKAIVYDEPRIADQQIPPQLRFIIRRAIEKDVSKRYQNVSLMMADLKKVNTLDFENIFAAETIPDFKFPTEESATHFLNTGQNDETVKPTLRVEQTPTADPENLQTIPVEQTPATPVVPQKDNRHLKLGGGFLAAAVFLGGAGFIGLNLTNPSPADQPASNPAAAANANTSPTKNSLYNRSLWAEWALMLENDDYEKIISETSAEIERDPNNSIAYRMRATAYYNLEKTESGRLDVREVLRLSTNPTTAEEYESRCYALKVINKPDEALENCTKAIELDPQMALAYNIRGTIYHQKQMYDPAVAEYSKAIELSPRKTFFENRALAYRALGDKKLAAKDDKEATALAKFNQANQQPKSDTKRRNLVKPTPAATPISTKSVPESRKTPNAPKSTRKPDFDIIQP